MAPSLNEFMEAEAPSEPSDVVDTQTEPEAATPPDEGADAGESPQDQEPAGTPEHPDDAAKPERTDPETPEKTEDREEKDGVAPADADALVEETVKLGWPKPEFDPNALTGEALKVQQHWRKIFSVSRQEVAEFKKQFEGIDPEDARQHKAVHDDVLSNPKYAPLRALAGIHVASDPEIDPAVLDYGRALLNTNHVDHLKAIRAFQTLRAGGPAPASEQAPQLDQNYRALVEQATDQYGDFDEKKFNTLMAQRDRALATRAYQAAQKRIPAQASDASTPEAKPGGAAYDLQQFADFHGLDANEIKPLMIKELHLCRAEGIEPEDSPKGLKMLWDRVQKSRATKMTAERQADVARLKGASTSRPRSAISDGGSLPGGLRLYDFAEKEAESNL